MPCWQVVISSSQTVIPFHGEHSLLKMTSHGEVSISLHKATTLPLSPAYDSNNNNEVIPDRRSIQSLINSSKKPPYARIDTILTNFSPGEYGEGFYGMEVGDIPCRPTFLQKMDLDAVDERSNPVLHTPVSISKQ